MVKKQKSSKKKPAGGGAAAAGQTGATPASSKEPSATTAPADDSISVPQQQRLLNHFATAFEPVLIAADFPQRQQEIKQALFRRDFAAAFGRADYLAAYAARWSPTRALCYAGIFQTHLPPHLQRSAAAAHDPGASSPSPRRTKMVCVGGCAAEHVAFASYLQSQQASSSLQAPSSGELMLLDSAPWAGVAATMQDTLTAPLPLSQYASAAATAANVPLLQTTKQLYLQVVQQDALQLTMAQWADMLAPADDDPAGTAVVVTLLFTLNELYANGGIGQTTRLLKELEAALPDRSLLLVVDSPGSYAELALGKDKKTYPMQWLLHNTLTSQESTAHQWTRLESHDSIWFRLSNQLTYPIPLEDMRYQLHLYRIDKTPQS